MNDLKPRIISKTAIYGNQRWRINPDESYSGLAFGTTGPGQFPRYNWIHVPKERVPLEIKEILK